MESSQYFDPEEVRHLVTVVIRDLGDGHRMYSRCCTQFGKLVKNTTTAIVSEFGTQDSARNWAKQRLKTAPRQDKLLQFLKLAYHYRHKCTKSLHTLASNAGVQRALREYFGEGDEDLTVLEVIGVAEYPEGRLAHRLPLKRYHYISSSTLRSLYVQLCAEEPIAADWVCPAMRDGTKGRTWSPDGKARFAHFIQKGDGGTSRITQLAPVIQRLEEDGQIGVLGDSKPYFRWSGVVAFLHGHLNVVHYTGVLGEWRFLLSGKTRNLGLQYSLDGGMTFPRPETDSAFVDAVTRLTTSKAADDLTIRHVSDEEIREAIEIVHDDRALVENWIRVDLVAAVNNYDHRGRFSVAHGIPLAVVVHPRELETD